MEMGSRRKEGLLDKLKPVEKLIEKPIVIIGAGIGGLSTAIHLAARNLRVVILEQNPIVGGKMYQHEADSFYWDTGPSIITMRHVFDDLFAAAGRRLDEYIDLIAVDPLTRYFYSDGTRIDTTSDLSKMAEQIEKLDKRDVEGYLRFLAYAARMHRVTGPAFIYEQPPSLQTLTKVPARDILKIDAWRTLDQAIRRHVHSPYLRQLLGRYATYVGGSPYRVPATLSVIAHVELTSGVWYPRGGIHTVAAGMAKLARELGVEILTNSAVKEIVVENDVATGVRLANESVVDAAAVVANVDVMTVYQRLLPQTTQAANRLQKLNDIEQSCSGFVLLLGVEGNYEHLLQHNIFFCEEYRREFQDIFDRGIPPDDPTVYVSITSKVDAGHAPVGCENWFVLVNAPPAGRNYDWSTQATAYRDRVLATLAKHGLDVRTKIRSERIMTPLDIESLSGAWRGALYGFSSNRAMNAFRRPHNRSADIGGLYFAGGTTHPGGGVPMVTLSGKVAAEMVVEELTLPSV